MPYIKGIVTKVVKQYGTNNPFEIASKKSITVLYADLGSTFGFYFSERRMKFIHINEGLNHVLKRFVCAHELGHATLHTDLSTPFMRNNTFLSVDRIEKEANSFATKMLTHGVQALEGETKEQYCKRNGIPVEMVGYL